MTNMKVDFPAIDGRAVTERHSRICRERGHATHTVAGIDSGRCPRCGEVTAPVNVDGETFERILDLEAEATGTRALVEFAPAMTSDKAYAAKVANFKSAKARLYAALDALTADQVRAYGQYRLDHWLKGE